ncbi:MAG: MinD/ParA family protein [Aquabacterium sp.]
MPARLSPIMPAAAARAQPDQAAGLRQIFAAQRTRFVALAANPCVVHAGAVLERLTAAWSGQGLTTLVVDAAATARAPGALAEVDLGACIEALSPAVSYLAARDAPMRWLDARGSTAAFLGAVADAAPQADVVLVHAEAADLARLFVGRAPRPLLMAADQPESLTRAYAALKWLALRLHAPAFDLLIAAGPDNPRTPRIADSLADTADRFLGVALHDWALVDPMSDVSTTTPPLQRLAMAQLRGLADAAGPATAAIPRAH